MNNCFFGQKTLLALILFLLQFGRGNGIGRERGYQGSYNNQLIDNSLLFIIALYFICCCLGCDKKKHHKHGCC